MPVFAYKGRTRAGEATSGERVAESMQAAVAAGLASLRAEEEWMARYERDLMRLAAEAGATSTAVLDDTTRPVGGSVRVGLMSAMMSGTFSVLSYANMPCVNSPWSPRPSP